MLFFTTGTYNVGFEINKEKYFVLKFNSAIHVEAIGAFGCMYNRKAAYLYKTDSSCEGYSIRKYNWIKICKKHPRLSDAFNEVTKKAYDQNIKIKIEAMKKSKIEEMEQRNDFEMLQYNKVITHCGPNTPFQQAKDIPDSKLLPLLQSSDMTNFDSTNYEIK